jgi:2-C-methyl-D-erythritol 2,4-cyclodiphosphate synthase
VGTGYDVHPFAEGRPLILGGVEIPHDKGLQGHSDADVLCHAIADAILGAMGKNDIGHHFPPDDPDCEGISSLKILEKAVELMDDLGGDLCNIDSTLIAEAPKILPHIEEMKKALSQALRLDTDRIGIKATTNEKMGFVGREEGIAAIATASILMAK